MKRRSKYCGRENCQFFQWCATKATVLALAILLSLLAPGPVAASGCPIDRDAAERAAARGDATALTKMISEPGAKEGCSQAFRRWLARSLGYVVAAEVEDDVVSGAMTAEDAALRLAAANELASHWRLSALRAELAVGKTDWRSACLQFQSAIADLRSSSPGERPEQATVDTLFQRAEQACLLNGDTCGVKVPGVASAPLCQNTRDLNVESTNIAIEFEFDRVTLTEKGKASFLALYESLELEGFPAVRLIGHTDPTGLAAYNEDLSLDRARAVDDLLKGLGYAGRTERVGRGETDPLDNLFGLPEGEFFQVLRRVQIERIVE